MNFLTLTFTLSISLSANCFTAVPAEPYLAIKFSKKAGNLISILNFYIVMGRNFTKNGQLAESVHGIG